MYQMDIKEIVQGVTHSYHRKDQHNLSISLLSRVKRHHHARYHIHQSTPQETPLNSNNHPQTKISQAKSRIYLSTLYIGATEHDLIATLRHALQKNPNLHLSILTDALRGTRESPNPSCASLLAPLIAEFGAHRVEIRMFHTPNLTGLRKRLVPKRINEGWGLQHMKLYGVDDEIIMSGANLSQDYFTNRQDRYHLLQSKELTDYFGSIHEAVCNLSFDIQPADVEAGYKMNWPDTNPAPSPLLSPSSFRQKAAQHLENLLTPANSPPKPTTTSKTDSGQEKTTTTLIHPILSLPPLLQSSTELPALSTLLTRLSTPPFTPSSWTFTAGYFNTTPTFRRLLLATNPRSGTVLTAHPHANGFFGSKGVSGMLPDAYTHLARMFLKRVRWEGLGKQVVMKEWRRGKVGEEGGWTYHAKGLWITLPTCSPSLPPTDSHTSAAPAAATHAGAKQQEQEQAEEPCLTVIGSSNYTARSYTLDLEANVVITTSDPSLKRRLGEEVRHLNEYAQPVDESVFERPERRVGWGVRLSMWIVRVLGGAL